MPTLGEGLAGAIDKLTDLIEALDDGPQRDRLIVQQKDMIRKLHVLIDENVRRDTAEYVKATAALETANQSLVAARQDIAKVAQTIQKVAEVIDALAQLAASMAK